MHRNSNITDNLNSTLSNAGIFDFGHLQHVDFQHLFRCKNTPSFTGKEKDSETGFYYFGARYYDPSLSGLFLSVDPMADKYPSISPYAYCAWSPIRIIDPNGDSCAVLLARDAVGGLGHMAILVQNEENKWQLWSKNGDDDGTYKTSSGETRGTADDQPGKDLTTGEIKTFKTVQEFLSSSYNTEKHDGVGDSYYTEAYILPTTSKQDRKIEKGMQKKLGEKYNLISNNCSQAVVFSLRYAGVKLSTTNMGNYKPPLFQREISVGKGTIPIYTFKRICLTNPGSEILYAH